MQEFIRFDLYGERAHMREMFNKLAEDCRKNVKAAKFIIDESEELESLWDSSKKEFIGEVGNWVMLCGAESGNYYGNLDSDRIMEYVSKICGKDIAILSTYSNLSSGYKEMGLARNGKKMHVSSNDVERYVDRMELLNTSPWIPDNEMWINHIERAKAKIKEVLSRSAKNSDLAREIIAEEFNLDNYGEKILERAFELDKNPF